VDLNHFDAFFDAVAAYDSEGKVIYCNEAFSQIVGVSPNRIVNKTTIFQLFNEFDGEMLRPDEMFPAEPTNARVVSYTSKAVPAGTGQYSLIPASHQNKKFTLFVMRDLTLEEQLKHKYHREMASKDRKIDEMKSLIHLLQKIRLVKDAKTIIQEFGIHIINQFDLDRAYLLTPDKQIQMISVKTIGTTDPLINALPKANLLQQYIAYASRDLANIGVGFIPDLETLVVVPIRDHQKNCYMLVLPIFKKTQAVKIEHETIKTLAEQMSVMLEHMTLEKLSIYDDLTKIYNARYFRTKLDEYTAKYQDLSLILLDIDFFKKINDTYGHLAGDLVLTKMGEVLKKVLISNSVIARVGGEEFAVLLPNMPQEEARLKAESIAEDIRALDINYEGKVLKITSSFGIAVWEPGKMAVREFYKAADAALYESKRSGRNRITLYKAA
jgi:diguanylate cyclase (GGDEF)-like protein